MPATDLTCGSQANSWNWFSPATLWHRVIRPAVPTWQLFRWIYTEDCDNSIFNVTFERRDAVCSVSFWELWEDGSRHRNVMNIW